MKVLFVQIIRGLAGSEKYIIEAMPMLKERGIDCEFVCVHLPQDGDKYRLVADPLEEKGINVHYIETKNQLSVGLLKKINEIIKAGEFDLVNTHLIQADLWLALIKMLFGQKVKVVSTKHGYGNVFTQKFGHDSTKRLYNLYFFLARFSERWVTQSITVSNGLKKLYTALKISQPEKIETVHLGFKTNYEPTINAADCRKGALQICIVGRLLPLKGHVYALTAFKQVLAKYQKTQLVIIGDGESRENLEQLSQELGIAEQVHFLGFQKNAMDYMAQSDVVLCPSKSEGFGIVIIEAFEVTTPVVAFDVPACNELIVNGKSGCLVQPFDTDELATTLIDLLEQPDKRVALAEQAHQRLKTMFTPEKMIEKTIAIYQKVIG